MITKLAALTPLGRRVYATLMAMSGIAIAAGCATTPLTQWVPVTQAPPTGDRVRLRVRDSADSIQMLTLYYPRMEDDSILVGTPCPG